MAAEGLILVSSTTERGGTGDKIDADARTPEPGVKAARTKRVVAPVMEDGHVSQALRTVYQRAVNEDIPSEMLDLLSKLN